MAIAPTSDSCSFPAALLAAVTAEAERDAEDVAAFLGRVDAGPGGTTGVASYPPTFYLALGSVLRIARWQRAGIFLAQAAGLPTARQLLLDVVDWFIDLTQPEREERVKRLCVRVIELSATRLSWEGTNILGADVMIGDFDEDDDEILEMLAQYLWRHRHDRRNCESTETFSS